MIKTFSRWLKVLALVGLVSSCAAPKEPTFRGIEGFKMSRNEESRKLQYEFDLILFNPNRYAIKILDYEVDVYLNGKLLGRAEGAERAKLIRQADSPVHVEMQTDLMKSMKSLFGMAADWIGGDKEMKIRVEGRIKGRVKAFTKWVPIDAEFPLQK